MLFIDQKNPLTHLATMLCLIVFTTKGPCLMKKLFMSSVLALCVAGTASNASAQSNPCDDLAPVVHQSLTLCVAPDYYSVDGVRTPMGYTQALSIVDQTQMLLPTPGVVDAIYAQASVKLKPIPMKPGPAMTSVEYAQRHDAMIDQQLEAYQPINNRLIAGHKKDIVTIDRASTRVAIYGWHKGVGRPIQPYSTVHGRDYYDYSHGLRLISPVAYDSAGNAVTLTQQDLVKLH